MKTFLYCPSCLRTLQKRLVAFDLDLVYCLQWESVGLLAPLHNSFALSVETVVLRNLVQNYDVQQVLAAEVGILDVVGVLCGEKMGLGEKMGSVHCEHQLLEYGELDGNNEMKDRFVLDL